ncbi:hypothetical protein FHX42_004844 [Saccharopolyspora lacisalsi]|uniref:Uncharacterized protein n=1 Tax=Halosaccharopolyspora lacisalsi TaxID=1000566 RepID=A0A839E9C9_9PSEU|nr:hypothetical protein [Halosaccharopolyspora lacisalsi]MBA8827448.1 hypothetical protein [Halosaccharopolyspora lacisalsi]
MTPDADETNPVAARVGAVDPLCWFLVASMLLTAILMAVLGMIVVVLVIVLPAIAVPVFDSRVNRPGSGSPGPFARTHRMKPVDRRGRTSP